MGLMLVSAPEGFLGWSCGGGWSEASGPFWAEEPGKEDSCASSRGPRCDGPVGRPGSS